MNTIYTVLGIITFWSIVVYLAYEFVYPYAAAAVLAVDFLRWYDREAKGVNSNHVYKVGFGSRYVSAYVLMLERIREQRAGVTTETTHHSGAKYRPFH